MPAHPPFQKVFPTVASRSAMATLLNRHRGAPGGEHPINHTVYAGIGEPEYAHMLEVVAPMFFRPGVFAVSEFNGGKVAGVLVTLSIAGRHRWFLVSVIWKSRRAPKCSGMRSFRETGRRSLRLSGARPAWNLEAMQELQMPVSGRPRIAASAPFLSTVMVLELFRDCLRTSPIHRSPRCCRLI